MLVERSRSIYMDYKFWMMVIIIRLQISMQIHIFA